MQRYAIVFTCIIFLSFSESSAYLDPGVGSLALQFIIAGTITALFTLKLFWKKIVSALKAFFGKQGKSK